MKWDTSGDGMNDDDEYDEGTDPLDPDSDDGGIFDGVEIQNNMNPLEPSDDILLLQERREEAGGGGGGGGQGGATINDTDGDGLSNEWENLTDDNYLDYQNSDSDEDGTLDTWEDYDPDLLCNLYEFWSGNDPLDNDTDGDGLFDGLEDYDQDGLTNKVEQTLGTYPALWDSDYDGAGDGVEDYNRDGGIHSEWGETDPLDNDTDNDGLSDGFELPSDNNYNRLVYYIDADRYPDEFVHGIRFDGEMDISDLLGTAEIGFYQIWAYVEIMESGGRDLHIDFEFVEKATGYGLNEETYPIDRGQKWFHSNSYGVGENYKFTVQVWTEYIKIAKLMLIRTNYPCDQIVDLDYENHNGLDFEIVNLEDLRISDPVTADTDGDSVIDGQEILDGTIPLDCFSNNVDDDDDGLCNLLEISIGSDPFNIDSDNDGFSDLEEYEIYNSDPVDEVNWVGYIVMDGVFTDILKEQGTLTSEDLYFFEDFNIRTSIEDYTTINTEEYGISTEIYYMSELYDQYNYNTYYLASYSESEDPEQDTFYYYSKEDVRNLCRDKYREGMIGAVFVGRGPVVESNFNCEDWPDVDHLTDLFYEDIDGIWIDTNNDNVLDEHRGDVLPEIWVGRLTPYHGVWSEGEISYNAYMRGESMRKGHGYYKVIIRMEEKIKDYFNKSIKYMKGELFRPNEPYIKNNILQYVHQTEALENLSQFEDFPKVAFKNENINYIKVYSNNTSFDLLNRLEAVGPFNGEYYKFALIGGHGTESGTTFGWRAIYGKDIYKIDNNPFFYILYSCENGKYSMIEYLAGAYIFGEQGYGLGSLALTGKGNILCILPFYEYINKGLLMGTALLSYKKNFVMNWDGSYAKLYYHKYEKPLGEIGRYKPNKLIHHASCEKVVYIGDPILKT